MPYSSLASAEMNELRVSCSLLGALVLPASVQVCYERQGPREGENETHKLGWLPLQVEDSKPWPIRFQRWRGSSRVQRCEVSEKQREAKG